MNHLGRVIVHVPQVTTYLQNIPQMSSSPGSSAISRPQIAGCVCCCIDSKSILRSSDHRALVAPSPPPGSYLCLCFRTSSQHRETGVVRGHCIPSAGEGLFRRHVISCTSYPTVCSQTEQMLGTRSWSHDRS